MNASQERPLVTFALFAYNQEKYIREAVEGALLQTYSPLEIILSDDCSSDQTFKIMQSMATDYKGPHRIRLQRNASNKGISKHFSALAEASRGAFIIVAAGDDISLPNRTSHCVDIFLSEEDLMFVETSTNQISNEGHRLKEYHVKSAHTLITLEMLISKPRTGLVGASRAYRAELFRKFPPLSDDCPTEDSPTVVRGLIVGNGYYSPTITVNRRVHDASISHKSNIHNISMDPIERQFSRDIEYAVSAGYIQQEKARRLTTSLTRHMSSRRLTSVAAGRPGIGGIIRYSIRNGLSLRAIVTIVRLLLRRVRHAR